MFIANFRNSDENMKEFAKIKKINNLYIYFKTVDNQGLFEFDDF